MEQIFGSNKLLSQLGTILGKCIYNRQSWSVFMQGTSYWVKGISPMMFIHSQLDKNIWKKNYMVVAPFCQCNRQPPELYIKVWLLVLSPKSCAAWEYTASPPMPACLASFPLEISVGVGRRRSALNAETFSQNKIPHFHLSGIICTIAKKWLLCMTQWACRDTMEMGILPQMEGWNWCGKHSGEELEAVGSNISTYSSEADCTGLDYICPGKGKSKHLRLQLLCLKGLVTKFLWKMLSDFQTVGKKSKLVVSKLCAFIFWTARKFSFQITHGMDNNSGFLCYVLGHILALTSARESSSLF